MPLSFATGLRWLLPKPTPEDLPILPMVHDGRHDALVMIHLLPGRKRDYRALRFWRANVVIAAPGTTRKDGGVPVWLGTITRMTLRRYGRLLTVPKTQGLVPASYLEKAFSTFPVSAKVGAGRRVLLVGP